MNVEVIERRRFYKGKHRLFWEVRVDGKIAEVTLFDPTDAVEEVCKEIEKNGGKYSREDIKMDGNVDSTEEHL